MQTICCWLCTRDWLSKKDRCIPFLTRDAQVGFVHGGTAVWGIAVASCSASRKHSVMESPPLDLAVHSARERLTCVMGSRVNLHVASFFLSDETIHGPASPLLLTDELLPRPCLLVLDDLHKSFGRKKGEGREGGKGVEREKREEREEGGSRLVAGLRHTLSESASCKRLMRGSPQMPRS